MQTDPELLELARKDPIAFVRSAIGVDLAQHQVDAFLSALNNNLTCYQSCHSVGKTFMAAISAVAFLLLYPDSLVIVTGPNEKIVINGVLKECKRLLRNAKIDFKLPAKQLEIRVNNRDDWKIMGISGSENSDASIQGIRSKHTMVIMDEGAAIADSIYEQADTLLASGYKTSMLILGNPTNTRSKFYTKSLLPFSNTLKTSAFDMRNLTDFGITQEDMRLGTWEEKIGDSPLPEPYLLQPRWVYEKYLEHGPDSHFWRTRILGEFPEEGSSNLFTNKMIETATRTYPKQHVGPIRLGLDVSAVEGGDKTVLCVARAGGIQEFRELKNVVPSLMATELLNIIKQYKADGEEVLYCNIDTSGVGIGVFNELMQRRGAGRLFRAFNGANTAKKLEDRNQGSVKLYANRRTEAYMHLHKLMQMSRLYIPRDQRLIRELVAQELDTDKSFLALLAKKHIKAKLKGDSPDYSDAASMAMLDIRNQVDTKDRLRALSRMGGVASWMQS